MPSLHQWTGWWKDLPLMDERHASSAGMSCLLGDDQDDSHQVWLSMNKQSRQLSSDLVPLVLEMMDQCLSDEVLCCDRTFRVLDLVDGLVQLKVPVHGQVMIGLVDRFWALITTIVDMDEQLKTRFFSSISMLLNRLRRCGLTATTIPVSYLQTLTDGLLFPMHSSLLTAAQMEQRATVVVLVKAARKHFDDEQQEMVLDWIEKEQVGVGDADDLCRVICLASLFISGRSFHERVMDLCSQLMRQTNGRRLEVLLLSLMARTMKRALLLGKMFGCDFFRRIYSLDRFQQRHLKLARLETHLCPSESFFSERQFYRFQESLKLVRDHSSRSASHSMGSIVSMLLISSNSARSSTGGLFVNDASSSISTMASQQFSPLEELRTMILGLEARCHPSNQGPWVNPILQFLASMTRSISDWILRKHQSLGDDGGGVLLDLMWKLLGRLVYSKNIQNVLSSIGALKDLIVVDVQWSLTEMLPCVVRDLRLGNEPHRMLSSLGMASCMCRAVFQSPQSLHSHQHHHGDEERCSSSSSCLICQGKETIVQLAMDSMDLVDCNDSFLTLSALSLVTAVLQSLPLEMGEHFLQICERLLQRSVHYMRNLHSGSHGSGFDRAVFDAFHQTWNVAFSLMNRHAPAVAVQCWLILKEFVMDARRGGESLTAVDLGCSLMQAANQCRLVELKSIKVQLMRFLVDDVCRLVNQHGRGLDSGQSEESVAELRWQLSCALGMARYSGDIWAVECNDALCFELVGCLLPCRQTLVVKATARIIKALMRSWTDAYVLKWKDLQTSTSSSDVVLDDVNVYWHEATEAESCAALKLLSLWTNFISDLLLEENDALLAGSMHFPYLVQACVNGGFSLDETIKSAVLSLVLKRNDISAQVRRNLLSGISHQGRYFGTLHLSSMLLDVLSSIANVSHHKYQRRLPVIIHFKRLQYIHRRLQMLSSDCRFAMIMLSGCSSKTEKMDLHVIGMQDPLLLAVQDASMGSYGSLRSSAQSTLMQQLSCQTDFAIWIMDVLLLPLRRFVTEHYGNVDSACLVVDHTMDHGGGCGAASRASDESSLLTISCHESNSSVAADGFEDQSVKWPPSPSSMMNSALLSVDGVKGVLWMLQSHEVLLALRSRPGEFVEVFETVLEISCEERILNLDEGMHRVMDSLIRSLCSLHLKRIPMDFLMRMLLKMHGEKYHWQVQLSLMSHLTQQLDPMQLGLTELCAFVKLLFSWMSSEVVQMRSIAVQRGICFFQFLKTNLEESSVFASLKHSTHQDCVEFVRKFYEWTSLEGSDSMHRALRFRADICRLYHLLFEIYKSDEIFESVLSLPAKSVHSQRAHLEVALVVLSRDAASSIAELIKTCVFSVDSGSMSWWHDAGRSLVHILPTECTSVLIDGSLLALKMRSASFVFGGAFLVGICKSCAVSFGATQIESLRVSIDALLDSEYELQRQMASLLLVTTVCVRASMDFFLTAENSSLNKSRASSLLLFLDQYAVSRVVCESFVVRLMRDSCLMLLKHEDAGVQRQASAVFRRIHSTMMFEDAHQVMEDLFAMRPFHKISADCVHRVLLMHSCEIFAPHKHQQLVSLLDGLVSVMQTDETCLVDVKQEFAKILTGVFVMRPELAADFVSRRRRSLVECSSKDQMVGSALIVSALVNSRPFDVAVWMPDLLASSAQSPLMRSSLSRGIMERMFLDFKRTHQETWQMVDSLAFDSEQLDLVNELLIGPSYYA